MGPQQTIEQLLRREHEQGFFTHSYVACGRLSVHHPVWEYSCYPEGSTADVFDLASLTKALVTGPLVFQRLEALGLTPAATLGDIIGSPCPLVAPWLHLSIDELLGHHAGLPAWWNFWMGRLGPTHLPSDRDEILEHIGRVFARIPALSAKMDLYSDLGYILLGLVLEWGSKHTLAHSFQHLTRYLGVDPQALHFPALTPLPHASYVPSAFCRLRERLLVGEVHDENCAALGGISGHAGLFGRGPALRHYLQVLYHSAFGQTYLVANEAKRRSSAHEGLLGLRRGQGESAVVFADGQGMGHLGFTGTAFWLDLATASYAIFLTNRVISGRVNPHITSVRRQVFAGLDQVLRTAAPA